MINFINLPGIGGSGNSHWQTVWEASDDRFKRFEPSSWEDPKLDSWIDALDHSISSCGSPPVLVAHSLSCLLIMHWARKSPLQVAGAFLVGVPDPLGNIFPPQASTFQNVPFEPMSFPVLILASSDDPYSSLSIAEQRSRDLGCSLIEVGKLGHISDTSNIGNWQQGRDLLSAFVAGLQ